jgi:aldehyde:ferredoxin oxidoreductase
MISKSPQSGTIMESNIGGAFGPELKFAGYDGIVITGKSDRPVWLRIEDDKVSIEDASPVWGRGVFETEEWLEEQLGRGAKSLTIGPAGENLVPFACISSESYRQFGRGGTGTLFGSKNLKAVSVKGTGGVQAWEIGEFMGEVAECVSGNLLTEDNMWAKTDGTPILVEATNEMGMHPTRNYTKGVNEGRHNLDAEAMDEIKIGDRACSTCPLGCGNFTSVNGVQVEGPEYETLCLGGSNCEINDLEQVMRFNRVCDDLGLDTMSAGAVIALAMDLTEQGAADLDLRFGQPEQYLAVLDEMSRLSTDRGRDLALGAAKLAAKYDREDDAATIKNMELPAYDPRGNYGIGLAYATAERGACHLRAFPLFAEDPFKLRALAKEVMDQQNANAAKWSMCLCDFWGSVTTENMAGMLTAGLGHQVSARDLDRVGERIWNLIRLYNQAAGFSAEQDKLPNKISKRGLDNGPHAGRVFSDQDFEEMKQYYYKMRGWDERGMPTENKLKELRLENPWPKLRLIKAAS